jgi:hypothetical protein
MDDGAHEVRFQVFMAGSMKLTVSWNIALCSLVEVYQCFRGAYCLNHQGNESPLKRQSTYMRLHGTVSRKAVIFGAREDDDVAVLTTMF